MNETLTLPRLISRLAAAAGCSPAVARKYLHDLFADVEDALAAGRSYTIEGIGEFAPGMDAANPVLFRPDPALAAALNEPFEAFTAVELPADYEVEEETVLPAADEPAETTPEEVHTEEIEEPTEEAPEEIPAVEVEAEIEETPEEIAEEVPEEAPEEAAEEEATATMEPEAAEPEPSEPVETTSEDEFEPEQEATPHTTSHAPWMLFVCGALVGLIIGLITGYFAGDAVGRYHIPEEDDDYDLDADTTEMVSATPMPESVRDTVYTASVPASAVKSPEPVVQDVQPAPVPTQEVTKPAEKEPVYDTITSTKFLTTMARNHYGVKSYWVFIYEANPDLGNPNHIRPGTRILIPDISTFREATPEATKAKAQQHLNRLAEKYKL